MEAPRIDAPDGKDIVKGDGAILWQERGEGQKRRAFDMRKIRAEHGGPQRRRQVQREPSCSQGLAL